jgi:hypothetical protein
MFKHFYQFGSMDTFERELMSWGEGVLMVVVLTVCLLLYLMVICMVNIKHIYVEIINIISKISLIQFSMVRYCCFI